MSLYVVLAIFIPALITFSLRALPFLLFSGDRKMPDWLSRLGAVLPSAIMAVLIVYCLKDIDYAERPYGAPYFIAIAATVGLHLWKRNSMASIFGGTILFMLLSRIM